MRTFRTFAIAVLALVASGQPAAAQSLNVSLFERYLEQLRVEAGIPGLSAVIVQNGTTIWDKGFGHQDVENLVAATSDTPYPITDLSQTIASTLLLQHCVDSGRLDVDDPVRRWVSQFGEDATTVSHLLSHTSASGGFSYNASRFANLTGVIEQCRGDRYARLMAGELLDRFSLSSTVPSHDITDSSSPHRSSFSSDTLDRYASILRRVAVPYRLDSSRRPVRSDYRATTLTAATGIVSSALDLARFDSVLGAGLLATPASLSQAWETTGSGPTGLGWFVQRYNGERLVWHFGQATDAYSSLVLKVPGRGLTLILLANSDGLSAPYSLQNGDVTTSLFARLFLRLFLS